LLERHRQRDVVGGARPFEAVEEPQPGLRRRQRPPPAGRFPEPPQGRPVAGFAEDEGHRQAGDGRGVEDGAEREFGAERRPGPGDEPGGQQRVAAEGEEVVVGADAARLEVQQLGEQLGQGLLDCAGRGPAAPAAPFGCGQRPPVELVVGGERQRRQPDDRGGNHVRRQTLGQPAPQRVGFHVAVGDGRVGDEPAIAQTVLADDDRRRRDRRVGGEHRFDLARFDPEPADLHLVVDPAEELQHSVGAPPGPVAGPVQTGSRRAERVGHEPFRGHSGAVEIAERHTGAADVQLAGHTGRDGLQPVVQDVGRGVDDRDPL
jgi:hypothetical protein